MKHGGWLEYECKLIAEGKAHFVEAVNMLLACQITHDQLQTRNSVTSIFNMIRFVVLRRGRLCQFWLIKIKVG